jgi:hypothetical protein
MFPGLCFASHAMPMKTEYVSPTWLDFITINSRQYSDWMKSKIVALYGVFEISNGWPENALFSDASMVIVSRAHSPMGQVSLGW